MTRQEFYEKYTYLEWIIKELQMGQWLGQNLAPNSVQMDVIEQYTKDMLLYLRVERDNQAIIDCCRLFPEGFDWGRSPCKIILFVMDVKDMAREQIWHLPPSDERYFIDCNGNCFFRDCIGSEPRQIPRPEYSYARPQAPDPQPLALLPAQPGHAAEPSAEPAHHDPAQLSQPTDTAEPAAEPLSRYRELDTERARTAFAKAIERGFMERTADGYKWLKAKALLDLFCGILFCGDTVKPSRCGDTWIVKKVAPFPITALRSLFGEPNVGQQRRNDRDSSGNKTAPTGWEAIMELV